MPGGTQEFLLKLRSSKLQNDELLEEFYNKVIENYDYTGNYYIVLIHSMYDIPGRASDGTDITLKTRMTAEKYLREKIPEKMKCDLKNIMQKI